MTNGALLLFVREDVPSRILNRKSKIDTETFSVEINLRKRIYLLVISIQVQKKVTWKIFAI